MSAISVEVQDYKTARRVLKHTERLGGNAVIVRNYGRYNHGETRFMLLYLHEGLTVKRVFAAAKATLLSQEGI